jgi:hypothetical protein
MIFFILGYFLGGATSLVIMGLAVAARRGDSERAEQRQVQRGDETTPALRERL